MTAQVGPGRMRWRKSSYSGMNNGDCVEIADSLTGIVSVRDSKDPNGSILEFSTDGWSSFVSAVQRGEFPAA